jgi:phospholipid/cholesterol/gamma-HCH transport system substrate-binding protein
MSASSQLKVGIFVLAGLGIMMAGVFLIGNMTGLWSPKADYKTAFKDVAGLKPGAPVRMGGLDIGQVTGVGHGPDATDSRIFVKLSISKKEASRIKVDSVAHVVAKGLLGDKMIELTVGLPDTAALDPTQLMSSEEPADVMAAANRVAAEVERSVEKLEPLAQSLGDPKFAADIRGSAQDIHSLLDAMVHGDGSMHRLFYEHQEIDRVDALLASSTRATDHLDVTLADLQDVTAHVRQGPGIAHALVYDGEMSKDTEGALAEVHKDLEAIRQGNGLAHALLYGDDPSQHAMANLNAISDDLRAIVAGVRQGKGTIGGLLVDPSIYEDIKSAVGNVERNEVLRALVRYSIKADESRPPPKVQP